MNLKFFTVLLLNVFLLISINSLSAQIGINENGAAPATSAMLDVVSSDKGVLIPRLTQTQRDAIPSPATGLLIFQSDNTSGFYYYNGITWSFVGILPTTQAAITANTAKVSADGVVTTHSDVTDAGSGKIITNDERTAIGTNTAKTGITTAQATAITANTAKVSANGLVTTHSDVTNAGSGKIITDGERTKLAGIETGATADQTLTDILTASTDAGAKKITNLGTPTADTDAATKFYVDSKLPNGSNAGDVLTWNGTKWEAKPPIVLDPKVGDFFRGGVIFHIFEDGEAGYVASEIHGLIAAPMDTSTDVRWGCNTTDIVDLANVPDAPPTIAGANIGYGANNTASIVDVANGGCSEAGAAKLCADLDLNGYTDWFLPSILELVLIYQNQAIINEGSVANDGTSMSGGWYWSSTEASNTHAWSTCLCSGSPSKGSKTNSDSARAIRAF